MKVKIGPYKNWFGPYQLADTLCWWVRRVPDEDGFLEKPRWVHLFGEWLAHGSIEPDPKPGDPPRLWLDHDSRHKTWLYRFLLWVASKRKQKVSVRIDPWDSWSAYRNLALVILPVLKQVKEAKYGTPMIDFQDVPEHLATIDFQEQGWQYIVDEMIFAFENVVDDSWEDQFVSGESDLRTEVLKWTETGEPLWYRVVNGPGHTRTYDEEGRSRYQERISRGLVLFGKYYRDLWT